MKSSIRCSVFPPYLVRAVHGREVEEARPLAAHLGPHAPHLVGVEVEEVQAAVVLQQPIRGEQGGHVTLSRPMAADLVDWVVVVVSPEEVAAHLVPLVQAGGAHAAHLQVVTPAPAQWPVLVLFLSYNDGMLLELPTNLHEHFHSSPTRDFFLLKEALTSAFTIKILCETSD